MAPQFRTNPASAPPSRKTATESDCWVPAGREITVAGYSIRAGLLYFGAHLHALAGHRIEPALIDPMRPVNRKNPDHAGTSMTYWPSYSDISQTARAAYLDWLASGRRNPAAYIGYVFLYFYGLERRALSHIGGVLDGGADIEPIRTEVRELLAVYGANNSFRRYATQFLDVLSVTSGGIDLQPVFERAGYELPMAVRVAVGRLIAEGRPLPADWALSWVITHPETSVRTPARRCAEEFKQLFVTRYVDAFGEGLVLKPNRTRLKCVIIPSSSTFGGQVQLSLDLPDIAPLSGPITKLRQLAERCEADLDAYSRWVGRNPNTPRTVAAAALLPRELAATHGESEATALVKWMSEALGTHDRAVVGVDDILTHCGSFGKGKLSKSEGVVLAQFLEKLHIGIEPDIRFGGGTLAPCSKAILFRLPAAAASVPSSGFSAATLLLHLAVAVSQADGTVSAAEEAHLMEHMQRSLHLTDAERCRLSAHLAWLIESTPSLSGLKKRLAPLDAQQRSAMADFIVSVAGADGHISPEEVKTLGKIYPLLGLPADTVYSHVHAMAAGATAAAGPVELGGPVGTPQITGHSIPPQAIHEGESEIALDLKAVNAKLAQSAEISAILGNIFADDEPAPPPPAPPVTSGKIPDTHSVMLTRLLARQEWTREEYEAIAGECQLLPDGAFEAINEAAFEHVGYAVLEGDDPIWVDADAARELIA